MEECHDNSMDDQGVENLGGLLTTEESPSKKVRVALSQIEEDEDEGTARV